MTIQIEVKNKALSVIGEPEIICGNSGYEIQFSFDAEWGKYPVKTARFLYNKHYEWQYEDVVFEGNAVAVPDVYDIEELLVGVYAGDICATTPVLIKCQKSILCANPVHSTPSEDVYNQIMEMLNEAHVDEDIPSYWENAVNEVENRITELQNIGGADTFTFGFITDTHTTSYNNGNFAKLMEHVLRKCNIPVLLHGGDFISGIGISSKEEHLAEIENHHRIFCNIEDRCLQTMGNHDAVFGVDANYNGSLTDEEVYNYIFRKNELKQGIVFGENNTYFYKDIPAQKTRYIVLNAYDHKTIVDDNNKIISGTKMHDGKIGSKQLTWLATTALNVPKGYTIVICTHPTPLRKAEFPASWGELNALAMSDVEVVRGLLEAYINKTTYTYNGSFGVGRLEDVYSLDFDFTNYNGEIVCWMAGHTHLDGLVSVNGLNVVATANCSSHIQPYEGAPIKTPGTDTEYIMDFVCVNKRTRVCNVVRLGAALEADATCEIATYTNFVDKASEGYQAGHRINASGTVVEDAGYDVSNYIPIHPGEVLHFKGWGRASNMLIVEFYKADKSRIGLAQWTGTPASGWVIPDYDSNVTCYDTNKHAGASLTDARYVRISGYRVSGVEQIATVNENIETTTQVGRGFNY